MRVGFPQLQFIRFAFLLLPLFLAPPAGAQDKSVKPGINAPYEKNPDPKKFLAKFEVESREAFTLRKEIVAACRLKPGMSVADVGAGTGLFTRLFAKEVAPGGTVYATDIAETFLKHIEVTCKEAGIKNVKTVLSKVDSSELPPGAVDVVFLCDVYHHFEFPQKTLASLHAALKPGGRLVVVDYRREKGKTPQWLLEHVRAGQEVFTREIEAAGFKLQGEEKFLKDNYMIDLPAGRTKGSRSSFIFHLASFIPNPSSFISRLSSFIAPIQIAAGLQPRHPSHLGPVVLHLPRSRCQPAAGPIAPGPAGQRRPGSDRSGQRRGQSAPATHHQRRQRRADAAAGVQAAPTLAGGRGQDPPLDRGRSKVRNPLSLHPAHTATAARDPARARCEARRPLGPQPSPTVSNNQDPTSRSAQFIQLRELRHFPVPRPKNHVVFRHSLTWTIVITENKGMSGTDVDVGQFMALTYRSLAAHPPLHFLQVSSIERERNPQDGQTAVHPYWRMGALGLGNVHAAWLPQQPDGRGRQTRRQDDGRQQHGGQRDLWSAGRWGRIEPPGAALRRSPAGSVHAGRSRRTLPCGSASWAWKTRASKILAISAKRSTSRSTSGSSTPEPSSPSANAMSTPACRPPTCGPTKSSCRRTCGSSPSAWSRCSNRSISCCTPR